MENFFRKLAQGTSRVMGTAAAFVASVGIVLLWLFSGPIFHFSDTWQLLINTATTIVTFLMVILIQHTQNHDAKAFHLKLDELIRAVQEARNGLVDLEDMSDEELDRLQEEFRKLRKENNAS